MGYPDNFGFRAGTCTPFLFYDLNLETTIPLRLHPYAINSQAMRFLKESEIEEKVARILESLKTIDGSLVAIFTNEDFSEYANAKRNFRILKQINEIN